MLSFIQQSIIFKDRLPMLKAYPNFCLTQSLLKALFGCLKESGSASMALECCDCWWHVHLQRGSWGSARRGGQGFSMRLSAEASHLTVHWCWWLSQALKCFTAVGREYLRANYCRGGMEGWFSFGSCLWEQAVHMAPEEDWNLTSTWK